VKILFNDIIQYSDAAPSLKSPALADKLTDAPIIITFDKERTVECIGIGNTDATEVTVDGETITLVGEGTKKNGLYILDTPITATSISVNHDGTYLGRLGAGKCYELGVKPSREPGLWSTSNSRTTVSGQEIPGAGGVDGRMMQVDTRYRLTAEMFDEIQESYPTQLARSFPFFVNFEKENAIGWIPWARLYGKLTGGDFVLQTSINKELYSKKFKFMERF